MFCKHCGSEMISGAKFCIKCGTAVEAQEINTSSQKSSHNYQEQWNLQRSMPTQQIYKNLSMENNLIKKKMRWWHILLIGIGTMVLLITAIVTISEFIGNSHYENTEDYADYVDSDKKKDISSYRYVEENYYDCYPRFGGNITLVLKFSNISTSDITIEDYFHDLGMYGVDEYDHEIVTVSMAYNEEEECYEFEFWGFWRLFTDRVEYRRYENNQKFKEISPVIPEDFWWYEIAKRQTGDYGADDAVDISKPNIGDIITIGRYEMDNDTSNGADRISWLVIDKSDKALFVISKYCLTCQKTNQDYSTWEYSDTRQWLNNIFYNEAFTTDEKARIINTEVVNYDNSDTGTDTYDDYIDSRYFIVGKGTYSISEDILIITPEEGEKEYNHYRYAGGKLVLITTDVSSELTFSKLSELD